MAGRAAAGPGLDAAGWRVEQHRVGGGQGEALVQGGLGHDDRGAGVAQHEPQALGGIGGLERYVRAAGLEYGENGDDELERTGQAHAHRCASADAELAQPIREHVGRWSSAAVGQVLVAADHRHRIRRRPATAVNVSWIVAPVGIRRPHCAPREQLAPLGRRPISGSADRRWPGSATMAPTNDWKWPTIRRIVRSLEEIGAVHEAADQLRRVARPASTIEVELGVRRLDVELGEVPRRGQRRQWRLQRERSPGRAGSGGGRAAARPHRRPARTAPRR